MKRRQWTFVIITGGPGGTRRFRVSRDVIRAGIAATLLGIAAISSAGTRALTGEDEPPEARLARRNALLEAELRSLRSRVDTLQLELDELSAQDEYFRLLAGLEPLDAEVRRVGPSGVGTRTLALHTLGGADGRTARQASWLAARVGELIQRTRFLTFSWREAKDTIQDRYDRLTSTPSILPTVGYVSSSFSHRRWHPILSRPRPHLGVDIVAPRGTPIVAAAKGTVRYVGMAGDYGLTVEVDHGFGYVTRYAHASRALVHAGQPVERGDVIGQVGDTGLTIAPHLHYEVLVNGSAADPRRFIQDQNAVRD